MKKLSASTKSFAHCHMRNLLPSKWPIGNLWKARIGLAIGAENPEVRQRRTVVIELGLLLGGGIGDAVGTREEAVEVVEAAVLRVDHDDGLDFTNPLLAPG